jgi:predicted ester cyclase
MNEHEITATRDILDRNITALNARDIEAYLANQQPDVELSLPGGATLHGHDQVRQYMESQWIAFPDGTLSFGEQVLGKDLAATEVVFTGTHTGPMPTPQGSIDPTGRRVSVRFASILHIKEGLVASEHVYLDQLEVLTQLGLTPAAPSTADSHSAP